jgi:hypothetical protein
MPQTSNQTCGYVSDAVASGMRNKKIPNLHKQLCWNRILIHEWFPDTDIEVNAEYVQICTTLNKYAFTEHKRFGFLE